MSSTKTLICLTMFALVGCASDPPSDDGMKALFTHDWDAANMADGSNTDDTTGEDMGQDTARAVVCEPSYGTTFDVAPGVPVFVGARFIEIQQGAEHVLQHAVIRTQVNDNFQVTFKPDFQDGEFTFDALLRLDVQNNVIHLEGTIASQVDNGEVEEAVVSECINSFGDLINLRFDLENHPLRVQIYVSKEAP